MTCEFVSVLVIDNERNGDVEVQAFETERLGELAYIAYCQSDWDRCPPVQLRGQRPRDMNSAERYAENVLSDDLVSLVLRRVEVQS